MRDPIKKLTPDLADTILKSVQKRNYDAKVSKESVLHHLKQVKAEMGKQLRKKDYCLVKDGIKTCMDIIDKKIAKINS